MNRFFAGVCIGFSALVSISKGEIVFTGAQHIVVGIDDNRVNPATISNDPNALKIDINGDGTADFSFFTLQPEPAYPSFVIYGAQPLHGAFYSGKSSITLDQDAAGIAVGPGSIKTIGDPDWSPAWKGSLWWKDSYYTDFRGYKNTDEFYFGVKFILNDGIHYAWIGAEFPGIDADELIIDGWAYESTPNTTILTGDIGAPASAVPEPTTYGFCGAGALVAVALLRRRRFKNS